MVSILGLSEDDQLLLLRSEVKMSFTPSRCPRCQQAAVQEIRCDGDGSLCHCWCGGGGWQVVCGHCDYILNQAECEEREEE